MLKFNQNQSAECAKIFVNDVDNSLFIVCFCEKKIHQLSDYAEHFATNHIKEPFDQAILGEIVGDSIAINELLDNYEMIDVPGSDCEEDDAKMPEENSIDEFDDANDDDVEDDYKDYDYNDNYGSYEMDDDDDDNEPYRDLPPSEDDEIINSRQWEPKVKESNQMVPLASISEETVPKLDDKADDSLIVTSFRNTDFLLVLRFIHHIREHPALWDKLHPLYHNRYVRDQISVQIFEDLQDRWNLETLTPKTIRILIWRICRWFEGEFIREKHCRHRGTPFNSPHPVYYQRLYEFIPHYRTRNSRFCSKCNTYFGTEAHLITHNFVCHDLSDIIHKCHLCGVGFVYPSALRHHELHHMKAEGMKWLCDLCGHLFMMKDEYDLHLHLVHGVGINRANRDQNNTASFPTEKRSMRVNVPCELCGTWFTDKLRFRNHLQWHQRNGDLCSKKLKQNEEAPTTDCRKLIN